jgi:aminoglycoside phosphotransferase (APT) family kinase protein
VIDQPRAVRSGEELDPAALATFLAGAVPGWDAVRAESLEVAQFGAGFSNLTYLVRADGRELVLRRPPRGVGAGSAHDVLREHRLLAALRPTFARVPRVLAACDDPQLLGAPFFVMERVHGVILRGAPGEPLPDAPTMQGLAQRFVDEMAALHALDWRAAGPGGAGTSRGLRRAAGRGWSKRWLAARTGDVPTIDGAARGWRRIGRPSVAPRSSTTTSSTTTWCSTRRTSRAWSRCSTGRWRRSAIR